MWPGRTKGWETELVYRLAGRRPGFYAIATDEAGERRFYYWRREAAARSLLEDGRDGDLAARLQGSDTIYLSGITLAILGETGRDRLRALLQDLRKAGTTVAFDGNHRPALWPEPAAAQAAYETMGRLTDIALPTFDDEAALQGDSDVASTAQRWLGWGAREVVVKLGAAGCAVFTPADHVEVPGPAGRGGRRHHGGRRLLQRRLPRRPAAGRDARRGRGPRLRPGRRGHPAPGRDSAAGPVLGRSSLPA